MEELIKLLPTYGNVGVMGIVSAFLIYAVKYITKEYKEQTEKLITSHKAATESYIGELNLVRNEKEVTATSFITYLKENNKEQLEIISENTLVFKNISNTNEAMTIVLKQLIDSINKRDDTTKSLNESILITMEILKRNETKN